MKVIYSKGRISVFGALSEVEFSAKMTEEKCNYETYLYFLKSLLRKYKKIFVVLDGVKYHFEKEHVQSFYENNQDKLKISQLPPYSPKLSPIEQTWKKIKNWLAISVWATEEEFEIKLLQALNNPDFMAKMFDYYLP